MIKNILQIEAKVEDWIGHWHLPNNTPLVIAEQMVMQYLQYLVKCKEASAAQAPAPAEETPVEAVPAEVVPEAAVE